MLFKYVSQPYGTFERKQKVIKPEHFSTSTKINWNNDNAYSVDTLFGRTTLQRLCFGFPVNSFSSTIRFFFNQISDILTTSLIMIHCSSSDNNIFYAFTGPLHYQRDRPSRNDPPTFCFSRRSLGDYKNASEQVNEFVDLNQGSHILCGPRCFLEICGFRAATTYHLVPGKHDVPNIIRSKVWKNRIDTNAAWAKWLWEIIMAIFRNQQGK